jgi:hypothetical protein
MRRTSKKKSDIREKTLNQMRNLQKRLEQEHPQLLSRIRKEIYKQGLYDAPASDKEKSVIPDEEEVSIDRRKNLETIMQFAHNHEGSPEFQEKLKKILMSVKH